MKLERDSSNFLETAQFSVLQEYVRPDPFKVIADSDFEDADDDHFFEFDAMTEIE